MTTPPTARRPRAPALPTLALAALSLAVAAPAPVARAQEGGEARGEGEEEAAADGLTFTFRRASVQTFIGFLSREAGFTFLEEAAVQGDITAVAEDPVSRDEALDLLRAWLISRDRTLLRNGEMIRIVTLEEAKRRGLPVRIGADPEEIPDTEEVVTQVVPLQYVQATDVRSELVGLLSEDGTIMVEGTSNSLVVRDTSASIRRFAEVLDALDRAVTAELHVKVYPLENARSDEVATIVRELFSEGLQLGGGGGDDDDGDRGGGRGRRMRRMARMFFQGRGGGGGGGGASVAPVNVSEDARTNSVVVTASTDQLRLVDELVASLDREPDPIVTEVRSFPLQHADAEELATTLGELYEESQGGAQGEDVPGFVRRWMRRAGVDEEEQGSSSRYAPQPRFTTDARTNTLIVQATRSDLAMIAQLVQELDADPTQRSGVLVVPLQHANAESLAEVLTGAIGEEAQGTSGDEEDQEQTARRGRFADRFGGGGGDGSDELGAGLAGEVTVVADTESNSLVFTTSPHNFDRLRSIVHDLDQPRREVFIEALIAEVQLNDRGELGIQWDAAFSNSAENAEEGTQTLGTDFGLDALEDGLRYTTSSDDLTGLLRALQTEGRLNILSSPKILVVENSDAEISVGQEVPFVTNSRITQNGDTVNTIQYRDVGIILQVTPQINDDGFVRLTVHPEVSSIAPDSQSVQITEGVRSPSFNRNFADTTIVVGTGETAVIGGLIKDSLSETERSIPLLGDIPIIGRLFGSTEREEEKQEIVIFLTPHVVEHPGELRERSRAAFSEFAYVPDEILDSQLSRWLRGLDDETHAYHYNRGTVLLEGGRVEEAITALERAADLEPGDAATRLNLGLALARVGELGRAERQLQAARRLDPTDPEIPYDLGAVAWRRGDYAEAVRMFSEALSLDPEHAGAKSWLPRAIEEQERSGEPPPEDLPGGGSYPMPEDDPPESPQTQGGDR